MKKLSEKYSITTFKPEQANKPWEKLSSKEKLMSLEPNKELLLQELKERQKIKTQRYVTHDLDSELTGKYRSSVAFDYVVAEDFLKDTDFIDAPFFINNMA